MIVFGVLHAATSRHVLDATSAKCLLITHRILMSQSRSRSENEAQDFSVGVGMATEASTGLDEVIVEDTEHTEVRRTILVFSEGEVESTLEPVGIRPVVVIFWVWWITEVTRIGFGDEEG